MDSDRQGRLFVSDVEAFVMPQMRQIIQANSIHKTSFALTLSEMTGNVSLAIMKKADVSKKGYIEEADLVALYANDQVGFQLVEDLLKQAPDFMDKHRQVISGAVNRSAGGSAMTNAVGS